MHVYKIYIIIKNNFGLLMGKLPVHVHIKTCNKSYYSLLHVDIHDIINWKYLQATDSLLY